MNDLSPSDRLEKTNAVLAEWAARTAADSDALIERFARMGYDVRGKSEDEVAKILKHPPSHPVDK